MNIINNLVQVEGQQFISTIDNLKSAQIVLSKIKFTESELDILNQVDFDFESFNKLKAEYTQNRTSDNLQLIQQSAPKFLYLKQRKKDADAVAVAVAVNNQVYLNKNVDNKLGCGAEATRYKYMAWINCFIQTFNKSDFIEYFDGADFICTESALDNRRTTGAPVDDACLDW